MLSPAQTIEAEVHILSRYRMRFRSLPNRARFRYGTASGLSGSHPWIGLARPAPAPAGQNRRLVYSNPFALKKGLTQPSNQ